MNIEFHVPGRPVPTARPRVTKWGSYYPKSTVKAQLAVREAALAAVALNWKRTGIASESPESHSRGSKGILGISDPEQAPVFEGVSGDLPEKVAFPSEALAVWVTACFPYAKNVPKQRRIRGRMPRVIRPDLDNLSKTVLDGMNGVVYSDDGQIAQLTISKWHTSDEDEVGFFVRVMPMRFTS